MVESAWIQQCLDYIESYPAFRTRRPPERCPHGLLLTDRCTVCVPLMIPDLAKVETRFLGEIVGLGRVWIIKTAENLKAFEGRNVNARPLDLSLWSWKNENANTTTDWNKLKNLPTGDHYISPYEDYQRARRHEFAGGYRIAGKKNYDDGVAVRARLGFGAGESEASPINYKGASRGGGFDLDDFEVPHGHSNSGPQEVDAGGDSGETRDSALRSRGLVTSDPSNRMSPDSQPIPSTDFLISRPRLIEFYRPKLNVVFRSVMPEGYRTVTFVNDKTQAKTPEPKRDRSYPTSATENPIQQRSSGFYSDTYQTRQERHEEFLALARGVQTGFKRTAEIEPPKRSKYPKMVGPPGSVLPADCRDAECWCKRPVREVRGPAVCECCGTFKPETIRCWYFSQQVGSRIWIEYEKRFRDWPKNWRTAWDENGAPLTERDIINLNARLKLYRYGDHHWTVAEMEQTTAERLQAAIRALPVPPRYYWPEQSKDGFIPWHWLRPTSPPEPRDYTVPSPIGPARIR